MRARSLVLLALVTTGACSDPRRNPLVYRDPARPPTPSVSRAVLTRVAKNPMALAVTPEDDVYYVERTGEVRLYARNTGKVSVALTLDVDTTHENGLLGLALDPDFGANRHVYLYYSLPLEEPLPVDAPPGRNVLARFTALTDGSLDATTRVELLSVPSERLCCHEGGSLAFAPDGTLYVSVGDNTNPFASSGAAPLDGRPGREVFDARRTAGNPFDLRGKILRIAADGSIPAGNLFPQDGSRGRPEVYTLGNRNPFRIAVDPLDGALYWGEIGPDANAESSYGPRGYDEVNRAVAPGDFGWPYCIADARPFAERDFETGAVGAAFDCSGTVPSLAAYDYDTPDYAALGTAYDSDGVFLGRAAMAGSVYRPPAGAAYALPERFQGALLMSDWTRDVVVAASVDAEGHLASLERLFRTESFHRPIDIETGADGAVYVLDYGSGFWGDNADASLSRIEYGTALSPIARLRASRTFGAQPLTVDFTARDSTASNEDETLSEYAWDFDADGVADARGVDVTHVFDAPGTHSVGLVVTASSGLSSFPVSEEIVVGNSPPSVHITSPDPLAVVGPGTSVTLEGYASDPEDGDAACEELVWNVSLGHNAHAHPIATLNGCTATFTAELGDHGTTEGSAYLFYAIELVYTDHGGPDGEAPLSARQGKRVDAAH
jgi:glucose/arabinose dehydrogenase